MNRKMFFMSFTLMCIGLLFSSNVPAAETNPCASDIEMYCKNIKPGFNALMECLEQNERKLTPACREHEKTMGGKRVEASENVREKKQFRQNCASDMKKLCANTKAGESVMKCLTENKAQLSAPCRTSMDAMDEEKK